MEELRKHTSDVVYETWRPEGRSAWATYRLFSVTVWLARYKWFLALLSRVVQIELIPPMLHGMPHLGSTVDCILASNIIAPTELQMS